MQRSVATVSVEEFLGGGEGRRALEEGPAFCLPHTEILLAVELPRFAGKKAEEFRSFCRARRAKLLAGLSEDLAWFIRKFDYRMAGEPWRGAEDAVERAVAELAGASGSEGPLGAKAP